jgi:hypothetical protein
VGILTYSPLAGGWLSGSWTANSSPTSPARQRLAARFDMSLPENQRKLEAVEQLAKVAGDVLLDPATLDRIDQIGKPGVNLNPADTTTASRPWSPPCARR